MKRFLRDNLVKLKTPSRLDEQDTITSKAPGGKRTDHYKRRSKRSKPGRPRKPRSMGRFPFLTCLNRYIAENRPYKAKSTLDQEERTLKRIHKEFLMLKADNLVSTVNPTKITDRDIGQYILYLKEKGIDVSAQAKYCGYLRNLLDWSGNYVMDGLNKKKKLPKEIKVRKKRVEIDQDGNETIFNMPEIKLFASSSFKLEMDKNEFVDSVSVKACSILISTFMKTKIKLKFPLSLFMALSKRKVILSPYLRFKMSYMAIGVS